jgi:hypothetical protein
VREYSREFAAQRAAAGLEAITLGRLRHSNISRMRAAFERLTAAFHLATGSAVVGLVTG